jgi:hypothetical protein
MSTAAASIPRAGSQSGQPSPSAIASRHDNLDRLVEGELSARLRRKRKFDASSRIDLINLN